MKKANEEKWVTKDMRKAAKGLVDKSVKIKFIEGTSVTAEQFKADWIEMAVEHAGLDTQEYRDILSDIYDRALKNTEFVPDLSVLPPKPLVNNNTLFEMKFGNLNPKRRALMETKIDISNVGEETRRAMSGEIVELAADEDGDHDPEALIIENDLRTKGHIVDAFVHSLRTSASFYKERSLELKEKLEREKQEKKVQNQIVFDEIVNTNSVKLLVKLLKKHHDRLIQMPNNITVDTNNKVIVMQITLMRKDYLEFVKYYVNIPYYKSKQKGWVLDTSMFERREQKEIIKMFLQIAGKAEISEHMPEFKLVPTGITTRYIPEDVIEFYKTAEAYTIIPYHSLVERPRFPEDGMPVGYKEFYSLQRDEKWQQMQEERKAMKS